MEKRVKELVYSKKIDDMRELEIVVRNDITWSIKKISFCYRDRLDVPVWTIPHLIEMLQEIYNDLEKDVKEQLGGK